MTLVGAAQAADAAGHDTKVVREQIGKFENGGAGLKVVEVFPTRGADEAAEPAGRAVREVEEGAGVFRF